MIFPPRMCVRAIAKVFDLRPRAIIHDLDLLRPIYRQLAAYGYFGRDDRDLTWERTDRADALREAVGLYFFSKSKQSKDGIDRPLI